MATALQNNLLEGTRASNEQGEMRNRNRAAVVTNLRGKIIDKLEAGVLPDRLPEKLGGGFGGGRVCDACDGPILMGQVEYTYELGSDRILRLHIGCAGLWQAELLRRGVKRAL